MAAIQRLGMSTDSSDRFLHSRRGFRFATCALVFLFAFGVRVLSWQDTRFEVGKVQTGVTAAYEHMAQLLRQGGALSFFRPTSPLADLNYLGHPPGYSILIAFVHSIFNVGTGLPAFPLSRIRITKNYWPQNPSCRLRLIAPLGTYWCYGIQRKECSSKHHASCEHCHSDPHHGKTPPAECRPHTR